MRSSSTTTPCLNTSSFTAMSSSSDSPSSATSRLDKSTKDLTRYLMLPHEQPNHLSHRWRRSTPMMTWMRTFKSSSSGWLILSAAMNLWSSPMSSDMLKLNLSWFLLSLNFRWVVHDQFAPGSWNQPQKLGITESLEARTETCLILEQKRDLSIPS